MAKTLEIKTDEAWREALSRWSHPSVPGLIAPETQEELLNLGNLAGVLSGQLAFMKYPEFQTYLNIHNTAKLFKEDPQRGIVAVLTHEVGHRFCPYDTVTSIILAHNAKKAVEGQKLPYSPEEASKVILNLFTDMCINTARARAGDSDIVWAYQAIAKDKAESKLWKVYARSMELAWDKKILPEDTKLNNEEQEAAISIAGLFKESFFSRDKWAQMMRSYAGIISKFLEDEQKDRQASSFGGDISENIPSDINEKTSSELAKRIAEIGSNGVPANPSAMKEFRELMAGFGRGEPKKASILFYDMLSSSYEVMFAQRPFGRPRVNPFQPIKWQPSMGVDRLDVDFSAQTGGRVIPGVNTYAWNVRRRDSHGGLEEVVPNLDLYIDSSGSMVNPIESISLPVLAAFVAAKKAHKKGAYIRATVFSGEGQSDTCGFTRDLNPVFNVSVTFYGGGTFFPVEKMLEAGDPKQVLIITDTFLANTEKTAGAISKLRQRHKGNKVSIYAISPVADAGELAEAGADIIQGTTTDIFKRVIGESDRLYSK